VLVVYRGTVGAAPHQPEVEHRRSPLLISAFEPGKFWLELQPGLNLVVPERWAYHAEDGEPTENDPRCQLREMIRNGYVVKLDSLPNEERSLSDLIDITIDTHALEALREHVTGHQGFGGALYNATRAEDRRRVLLSAIDRRLKTTTVVSVEPEPFRIRVPGKAMPTRNVAATG